MVQLDIQLTEHFTLRELCDSETARSQKLPNIPGPGHIMKLKNLLTKSVEPARRHFGVPFRITSGYRCEAVNRMVGGVSTLALSCQRAMRETAKPPPGASVSLRTSPFLTSRRLMV